jgi:solute carrier family 25 (mitochondrial phosphate transporter), member 3
MALLPNRKAMQGAVAYGPAGAVDLSAKYGMDTYMRFGLAGALCCSITHTAVVPIDVVKTRLQVRPCS